MSIDTNLKQKALKQLARTAGEVAQNALNKEVDKIDAALQIETQYDQIVEQLELLDTIAYRVHEKAVEIAKTLMLRLETLKLTYQNILGYPAERLHEYQNNNILGVKVLEMIERLRYYQPIPILDMFFQYSAHINEDVAKQAKHGLETLAGYDLAIFYGNGKDWSGLGWGPQEKVIEKISSFNDMQKCNFFSGIVAACNKMLSPTIEGTSWSYKSVTIRSGAVPAMDGVKAIRRKTLDILQNLYALVETIEQKKIVIGAMHSATRTPHIGAYGDDVLAMIMNDTLVVLQFMKGIVENEDLQIIQRIEHDAYFFFRRGTAEQVKALAVDIKKIIDSHAEYQIFKILIGFQGVFSEWKEMESIHENYDREKTLREQKAAEFAASISEGNYPMWKERILNYAGIKSNDLATFPYFGKFLESFGRLSPTLALRLLSEASDQLEGFMIPILCGISETDQKSLAYQLMSIWLDEGHYLFILARFFEFAKEVDEDLLKKIYVAAKAKNDLSTLNQIIATVSAQYAESNKHLIKDFFLPALKILTEHNNSGWIFGFWYREQRKEILAALELTEHQIFLDNLLEINEINYDVEEILCEIAEQSPELVLQFFCKRLTKEGENIGSNYDAIPFSFHKLSEPLSKIPEQVVDVILGTYDDDHVMFIYKGARLIKMIFPGFPKPFEKKLVQIVQTQVEKNLLFVMAILRNYEGQPFLHDICKELVMVLPENSKLLNEASIILESTGVVTGEYGFVEVYKRKIEEIKPWLDDKNEKIQSFIKSYISDLEKQIEAEQQRADEDIALRKHRYGVGEDD